MKYGRAVDVIATFLLIAASAASAHGDVVNADSRQSVKSLGAQSLSGSVEPHSGMFTTSVPIAIPPGTGGLQPRLSLTYSSSSRSGNAGKGWSLSMPAITLHRGFGAYNAQSWTLATAVFAFNGQRLVRSGTTEAVPADLGSCIATRYYTEVDDFSKILLCEGAAAGPYWVVLEKNGVRSTYGYRTAANSRLTAGGKTLEYYLDEVRDPRGLSWRATYAGSMPPHLARIEYTFHNGVPLGEARAVDFVWEPRPDRDVDYFYGFELKSDLRLQAIQTELGGSRVSRYVLTYDADPTTSVEDLSPDSKASMLSSVRRFGVADSDAFPAMTFRYQFNVPMSGTPGFSPSGQTLNGTTFTTDSTLPGSCGSRTFDYLDINGDGFLDSVDASKAKDAANPHWDVKLGTGNGGYDANAIQWKINTGGAMPLIQEIAKPSQGCDGNGGWPNITWALIDMNGDRRPDLYGQGAFINRITEPRQRAGIVLLNNGTGFDRITWTEPQGSAYLRASGHGRATEHRFRESVTYNTGCKDDNPCPLDTYSRSITVDADADGCADRFELDYAGNRPQWLFFHNRRCDPIPFNGFAAPIVWSWPSGVMPPDYMVHERDAVSRHATGSCHCQPGQDPMDCCTNIGVIVKSIYGNTSGLIDINQDGLIDFVSAADNQLGAIYLGTGKGFIAQTGATSYQGSGWTNQLRQGGIIEAHYDINGDGLKDAVSFNQDIQYLNCLQSSNNQNCQKTPGPWYWSVRLNTGTNYAPPISWLAWDGSSEFAWIQGGYGSTTDATGAYKMDHQLRDIDGDGLVEVVRSGTQAFKNASGNHPDLLTTISNGFGGTLSVDYTTVVSGPPGSALGGNLASPMIVVARTSLDDGMNNPPTQTTYQYGEPYFDPDRRQFLGFGRVTTSTFQDRFGAYKTMTIYGNGDPRRKIIDDWGYSTERFRDGFEVAGKAYFVRTGSYDREIVNRWERVTSGPVKAVVKRSERVADIDPAAVGNRKWRQTSFTYDSFGNVTSVFDGGESRFMEDSNHHLVCPTNQITQERICLTQSVDPNARYLVTTYAQNTTAGNWMFKPSEMKTCTSSTCAATSSVLGRSRMYYDGLPAGQIGSAGNLTRSEGWSHYATTPAEPDAWSPKELTYDSEGINVIAVKDALGAMTTFDFGTPSRAYVTSSNKTVALGKNGNAVTLSTATEWDERFGSPRRSVDENGRVLATTVDGLGRIIRTESSPPDNPAGAFILLSTVSYALQGVTANNSQNSITTRLFDSGTSRDSVVYFDGLGRSIEMKEQMDPAKWVTVSRRYRWEGLAAETLPYFTDNAGFTSFDFFANPLLQGVNEYAYDSSRRITQTALRTAQNAQVDVVRTTYSNPSWSHTVTDPNGYSTVYTRDAWGNVVKVRERDNSPSPNVMATTALTYQLDDLVSVADAATPSNVVRFEYDTLRRRRAMFDPNISNCAGGAVHCPVSYSYDLKNRLITETKANGQSISIDYDEIDRPYRIDYSAAGESDISIQYDTGPNSRSRRNRVTRGSVEDSLTYDNWGRVTRRARSLDGTVTMTNTTLDWTGRPLTSQYPDGTSVSYTYNLGGLVRSASIATGTTSAPVVSDITYDPLGRSIQTVWGSGAKTIATYDGADQRLARLAVRSNAGTDLTDLQYAYDARGNLTSLVENVEPSWKREFSYDWGNRLTASRHLTRGTAADCAACGSISVTESSAATCTAIYAKTTGAFISGSCVAGGSSSDCSPFTLSASGCLLLSRKGHGACTNPVDGSAMATTCTDCSTFTCGLMWCAATSRYVSNCSLCIGGCVERCRREWGNCSQTRTHAVCNTCSTWVPQKIWTWQYDAIGNITSRSGSANDGNYVYSGAGPHAVTRIGANSDATFTYDVNGNMVTEKNGQVTYGYGTDGSLLAMSDSTKPVDPAMTLRYGGDGDRVQKRWLDEAGVPHDLRYFGKHYQEHRIGSALDRDRYVFIGGARAAFVTDGAPGKIYYLHPEMPGVAGLITDEQSGVTMSRLYGAFGDVYETRLGENPGRYGYRGAERDDESGLLHLGVRQYSPAMNRWPQPDPIVSPLRPQSLNRYSFALNDPVRYVDPSGFKSYQERLRMEPSPSGFNWETAQGSDCNWGGCDLVTIAADGTVQVVGLALSAHNGPPAQLLMLREMSKAAREQAAAARNVAQEIVDALNGINEADGTGTQGGSAPGVNVGRTDKTAGTPYLADQQLSLPERARAAIHNTWRKIPGAVAAAPGYIWGKIVSLVKSAWNMPQADKEMMQELANQKTGQEGRPDEQVRSAEMGTTYIGTSGRFGGGAQAGEGRDYGLVAEPAGYWDLYMPYGGIVPYAEPEFP